MSRNYQCQVCKTSYAKAEHLIRHERTHTGSKPFSCIICKRAFARQDSLLRHGKIHESRPASSTATAPADAAPGPVENATMETTTTDTILVPEQHNALPTESFLDEMMLHNPPIDPNLLGGEDLALDQHLQWPETENLLQSIISTDFNWLPLSTLPFPAPDGVPAITPGSITVSESEGHSTHRAVHDLSGLIKSLPSRVAVDVEGLTSLFIDQCFHEFWTNVLPVLPVLHRPTFVFGDCSHPLLLNAIALGSLFLTRKDALAKGEKLWHLAHTAVATNWQSLLNYRSPQDPCPGVQLVLTAVLGQTYAMLSGNQNLRTTSRVFHHLGIAWALNGGLHELDAASLIVPDATATDEEKDVQWKLWAGHMTAARALLAHYILDGQISHYSGETGSRHIQLQLNAILPEAAWEASTANRWIAELRAIEHNMTFREVFRGLLTARTTFDPSPLHKISSMMSWAVILEGLQSLSVQCREADSYGILPSDSDLNRALFRVHGSLESLDTRNHQAADAMVRWHLLCLERGVSIASLCQVICQTHHIKQTLYGRSQRTSTSDILSNHMNIRDWVQDATSKKTLLHAIAIQTLLEKVRIESAHGVAIPGAIFAAATVYAAFALSGVHSLMIPKQIGWREVLLDSGQANSGPTAQFLQSSPLPNGYTDAWSARNFLYDMNTLQNLLRRLCLQWRIALEMDQILDKYCASIDGVVV